MATKIFGITFGKKEPYDFDTAVETRKKLLSKPNTKKIASGKNLTEEEEQLRKEQISESFQPSLPASNSISPLVLSKYKQQDLTKNFIKAGVALTTVFALIFAGNQTNQWLENSTLDELNLTTETKTKRINSLIQYNTYKNNVSTKITTIAEQLQNDVDVQQIIGYIYNTAAAEGIAITSINLKVAKNAEDTGSCLPSDPFTTNSSFVGCVTVQGIQPSAGAVINFFNNIEGYSGFQDPFVNSTLYTARGNSFTGSFSFTSNLFSGRFATMKGQNIDFIIENGLNIGSSSNNITVQPLPIVSEEPTTETGEEETLTEETSTENNEETVIDVGTLP
jgi:hypothetical protein